MTETADIEARVARLEEWARTPGWLDQPATTEDGSPITMGDKFPIEARIMFGLFLAGAAFVVGVIIYAAVIRVLS